LFHDTAEIFTPLGVSFFGISSGRVPTVEAKVTYRKVPQPLPPFTETSVGGAVYFSRETFVILKQALWNVKAETGIDNHMAIVKSLIARQIAKSMTRPTI
jgi:hypothetical protein